MQVDFGVVSEGKPYFFTQFHKIDLDIWSHLIDRERERERERERSIWIHVDFWVVSEGKPYFFTQFHNI